MRMWKVNPRIMCRKHLLGEHLEMHMFAGCLDKQTSLDGYISHGLIELDKIKSRHDELVIEMMKRGYNHNSELIKPKIGEFNIELVNGYVDEKANLIELARRCSECKKLQKIEKFCKKRNDKK